jgi:CheY-like chemotaxis protein
MRGLLARWRDWWRSLAERLVVWPAPLVAPVPAVRVLVLGERALDLARALVQAGYTVQTVESSAVALRLVARRWPTVVVLVLDGDAFELCWFVQELRAFPGTPPPVVGVARSAQDHLFAAGLALDTVLTPEGLLDWLRQWPGGRMALRVRPGDQPAPQTRVS